jgi:hypothetical protein
VKKEEEVSAPISKCWNCGRTKSAVWRMKVMDDGKSVRVCNGELADRPQTVIANMQLAGCTGTRCARCDLLNPAGEEAGPELGVGASTREAGLSSSSFRFVVLTSASTPSQSLGQDAKHIAAMRKPVAPPVSSALKKSFKPPMAAPMTSPVRPSASTLATTAHPSVSTAQRGAMRNTLRAEPQVSSSLLCASHLD